MVKDFGCLIWRSLVIQTVISFLLFDIFVYIFPVATVLLEFLYSCLILLCNSFTVSSLFSNYQKALL